jgi:hypothetical protein
MRELLVPGNLMFAALHDMRQSHELPIILFSCFLRHSSHYSIILPECSSVQNLGGHKDTMTINFVCPPDSRESRILCLVWRCITCNVFHKELWLLRNSPQWSFKRSQLSQQHSYVCCRPFTGRRTRNLPYS